MVEMGFVDEESMVLALSRQLGVPAVDLDKLSLPDDVVHWLKIDIAERYGVFPLGGDAATKMLHLATSDPTNLEALQELSFTTRMRIQVSVAGSSAIEKAIRRYYYGERMTASTTTTPQALGVKENTYELQRMHTNPTMNAVRPPPPPARSAPPAPPPQAQDTAAFAELERKIDAINQRISLLEKHAANQVRALRGLFEVLVEKQVITREEYQAKVRKD